MVRGCCRIRDGDWLSFEFEGVSEFEMVTDMAGVLELRGDWDMTLYVTAVFELTYVSELAKVVDVAGTLGLRGTS